MNEIWNSCSVKNIDPISNEIYRIMDLSPVRFVHAHATMFTRIGYPTEGIVGGNCKKDYRVSRTGVRLLFQTET